MNLEVYLYQIIFPEHIKDLAIHPTLEVRWANKHIMALNFPHDNRQSESEQDANSVTLFDGSSS